jgi:hypothetical protein
VIASEARATGAVKQTEQGAVLAPGKRLVVELSYAPAGAGAKNGADHIAGQTRIC